jgi:hypothetical protein
MKALKNQYKKNLTQIVESKSEEMKDQEGKRDLSTVVAHKQEFDPHEDPINFYGFGIISYFSMIKGLALVFFVLTILNIPTMAMYARHNGFSNLSTMQLQELLTLGNLGFS